VRVLDELIAVAVAGDHQHVVAPVARGGCQRGDDVVGLETGLLEQREPKGLHDLAHEPHLLAEDVGRFGAVRLVVVDGLVPEGRLGSIERHGDRIGLVVAQQVDEHRREAVHRVGDLPAGGREIGRQGEERPVGEGVAVDEHELHVACPPSGTRSPAITCSATSLMVRRSPIALVCTKRNASCSLSP